MAIVHGGKEPEYIVRLVEYWVVRGSKTMSYKYDLVAVDHALVDIRYGC